MPTATGSAAAATQGFEMEELMHSPAAVQAVLRYLFARFDARFDGAPTLLILDEAWLFLDEPSFAARIRQWLKNSAQEKRVGDLRHAVACRHQGFDHRARDHRKLREPDFLLNPQATEPQIRTVYEGFGLNSRQIENRRYRRSPSATTTTIAPGQSSVRPRPGASRARLLGRITPQDQRDIDRVLTQAGLPASLGACYAIAALIGPPTCCRPAVGGFFPRLLNPEISP